MVRDDGQEAVEVGEDVGEDKVDDGVLEAGRRADRGGEEEEGRREQHEPQQEHGREAAGQELEGREEPAAQLEAEEVSLGCIFGTLVSYASPRIRYRTEQQDSTTFLT